MDGGKQGEAKEDEEERGMHFGDKLREVDVEKDQI